MSYKSFKQIQAPRTSLSPQKRETNNLRPFSSSPTKEVIIKGTKSFYVVDLSKELGQGTFGSVYMAHDNQNKPFAVKMINKEKLRRQKAEKLIEQELHLHRRIAHKNILKFIESIDDYHNIYIVLEYCSGGNLYQLLKQKHSLSEREAFKIFYELSQALEYLAQQNIVHRDVKVKIRFKFIKPDGSIRLCDFNWAQKLERGQKCSPVICGTTEYMPPEVVGREYHDTRVDIWSLGVVLYEMIHGHMLYKGNNQKEKIQSIKLASNFKINTDLQIDLQRIIHQLLSRIIDNRPSYKQIFGSQWVQRMIQEVKYSETPIRETIYLKVQQRPQSDRVSVFSNSSSTTMKSRCTYLEEMEYHRFLGGSQNSTLNNFNPKTKKEWCRPPIQTVQVKSLSGVNMTRAFSSAKELKSNKYNQRNLQYHPKPPLPLNLAQFSKNLIRLGELN